MSIQISKVSGFAWKMFASFKTSIYIHEYRKYKAVNPIIKLSITDINIHWTISSSK